MLQQQKSKLRSMNPDRQIDQLVYELYELTEEEIAVNIQREQVGEAWTAVEEYP